MDYELVEICKIAKRYNSIDKVTLFGSRARGDNSKLSDFDIAIYFKGKPEKKIIIDIEEINTLLNIDVTIIQEGLDLEFLENIKRDEVVVYMSKFEHKLKNLTKAIKKLEEVVDAEITDDVFLEEILRDSIIQRFEFCYELVWKTLKEYLIYLGFETESTPRGVFKTAYQNGIIENSDVWLDMIKDRNVSSHEYNENHIIQVADRIRNEYVTEYRKLNEKLLNEK